ncbi:MAG: hypothetical protein S0880_18770 [Actinomycetota bacterium]|nr:hypothetical protein [Actinomycetota bacterium]
MSRLVFLATAIHRTGRPTRRATGPGPDAYQHHAIEHCEDAVLADVP